jgi:hypothetical protein
MAGFEIKRRTTLSTNKCDKLRIWMGVYITHEGSFRFPRGSAYLENTSIVEGPAIHMSVSGLDVRVFASFTAPRGG